MLEIYFVDTDQPGPDIEYLDPDAVYRVVPHNGKQCYVVLHTGDEPLHIHGDARTIARNVALSKHSNQLIVCPNGKW